MTTPTLFPLQEIGSLAKPRWQLIGQRGETLDDRARAEFETWNTRVHFADPAGPTVQALLFGRPGEAAVGAVRDLGALFGLRYFEEAGLQRVYDGEARRIEMYEYPIRQMQGFQFFGHVRSFDSKYYLKAAATGPVRLERPYHLDEFDFVKAHTERVPKVPITGPYTLAEWSYNEHYLGRQSGWKGREVRRRAQSEFVTEIARQAIRPTLKALIEHGATVIQIDEPAAGTHPDEAELVVEGFNAATEGLDATFSMHICFSDYATLFPAILEAKACQQWAWEFANRDTSHHDGYEVLKLFREYGDDREIGLGVLDVHRDEVESPELVAARIVRAAGYLGDPERIWVNPDCGLRTRSLDVAARKLKAMAEGARAARKEFGAREN
ncbi:MAG: hypothetical protein L3J95_04130 [Thermoplasmata archaeon]|nr:hypothetical protein [Thermoplasmata archaeon]MCI4359596.1 hypothetical protein [Thermoplasmata archaeon]